LTVPASKERAAPWLRLATPEAIAASWSAIGRSGRCETAIGRPSADTAVDLKRARMLGLFVVGQLAARHGIRVHLRRSRYAGVTALVLLPTDLVEPSDPLAAADGRASQGDTAATKGAPWCPVAVNRHCLAVAADARASPARFAAVHASWRRASSTPRTNVG
jgi:hypothetical protein